MALFGALTALSAGVGLFGQINQRQSDKAISKFNASQVRKRAALVSGLAEDTVERKREAQMFQEGQTIAEFAARGIDVTSGTVMTQLTTQARLDEANNSAELFQANIASFDAELNAKLIEFGAKNTSFQQGLGIFGSALGFVGGLAK